MKLLPALCLALAATPALAEDPAIVLDATGLTLADGTRVDFDMPAMPALASVSSATAAAAQVFANPDCGAGPMEFAAMENGLTLVFQDGRLTGWMAGFGGDGAPVATASGLSSGLARDRIEGAKFEETTLGMEFEAAGVFGLLDGDRKEIELIWAGASCFFR